MKLEELSKAAREDMPQFEENIRKVLQNPNSHTLGKKNPVVKLWKKDLLKDCKSWNKTGIQNRLAVLGVDVNVSTTSLYATLNFRNELERTKFLWKFDHPSLKEEK